MIILSVDPGTVRIGVAISDASGTIATPLEIFTHKSREVDARRIASMAAARGAERIIIGQSLDEDGQPTESGRSAARLAAAVREASGLPVELVEESFTTADVLEARLESGMKRKKRRAPPDAEAAALLLQNYLDSNRVIRAPSTAKGRNP
ncbi:MAG: Holliday junction resolvase RuvX [Anaerolineales bacterium]